MINLDKRRINFVKELPLDVRAKVLYEYLKKGTSNRNIENIVDELRKEDGWQAWSVIHFYGFSGVHKGKYPYLTLKRVVDDITLIQEDDLEDFHLTFNVSKGDPAPNRILFNEKDGKDVFRNIKTRQGQHKLRKIILQNYGSKCAMCNIQDERLLITSHIKPWSSSTHEERIDPQNSILLCKLHDALFENGLISLTDEYSVLLNTEFDYDLHGLSSDLNFSIPHIEPPHPLFLRQHRIKFGYEKN
ncbi:HNH endonuclease signature motif containing protein [Priestia koreensis]|uniref:HNH endonuclease n=1 Tax=Priestia koreensis TaxID=284581 RepID=UPI003018E4F3